MLTVKRKFKDFFLNNNIFFSFIKHHQQSSSGNLSINRLIVLSIIQIEVVINQLQIRI
jgi:hypothetical protein